MLYLQKKDDILVHVDRETVIKKYCHAEYKCVLSRHTGLRTKISMLMLLGVAGVIVVTVYGLDC